MAPGALALQAILGQPINIPLIVASSAVLFLLVIARMSGMMRTQERAAERERILRRAGAVLATASDSRQLYSSSLAAVLDLLRKTPGAQASLWLGSEKEMEMVATSGEHGEKVLDVPVALEDLPESVRLYLREGPSVRVHPSDVALLQKLSGQEAIAREIFVVPLRTRGELTGTITVACNVPLSQESKNAIEALGAEIALVSENFQLIEDAKRISVLEERQRLSHEIHDTLAQGFTSITMSISAAQLAEPHKFSDSTPARRHLDLARRIARDSLAESRRLVWALRPSSLDRHTLPAALASLAEEWSEETRVDAKVNIEGDCCQLLPGIEVALLRIAQETLANIHKHADASRALLTLSYMDDLVFLEVSDDGVGFDPTVPRARMHPQDAGGFGLVAMRERVEQLGGRLLVESTLGRGTTLTIELPVSLGSARHTRYSTNRGRDASKEAR